MVQEFPTDSLDFTPSHSWVSGAEQEYSFSKAKVKHDEHGHQMDGWLLYIYMC